MQLEKRYVIRGGRTESVASDIYQGERGSWVKGQKQKRGKRGAPEKAVMHVLVGRMFDFSMNESKRSMVKWSRGRDLFFLSMCGSSHWGFGRSWLDAGAYTYVAGRPLLPVRSSYLRSTEAYHFGAQRTSQSPLCMIGGWIEGGQVSCLLPRGLSSMYPLQGPYSKVCFKTPKWTAATCRDEPC